MKKAILVLLFTFGIKAVFAKCSMSDMAFLPEQKEISLNSMFIIQGYALSQKTIDSFKKRTIFLESENGDLVELLLIEILKGKKELTQAIFKASEELKPYTTYFLKYSNQTEIETHEMTKWNSDKNERERVYWKTTDKKSAEPLNSELKVVFEKTEVVLFGCGPSSNAIFDVKNQSNSEVWFKTEVIDLTTNEKTIYYIREWNGKLQVGHGMCAGAFTFNEKGKYKVRFTPMNTDGKSLKTTDWITFESPFMNDKNLTGY